MSETPLERLLSSGEAARLGADAADAFVAAQGAGLLLFTGDPAQRAEAQDVAHFAPPPGACSFKARLSPRVGYRPLEQRPPSPLPTTPRTQ